MVQIRQQRLDVLRERWRAAGAAEFVRVEIAVRALAYAPGQVDVERQGRRGEHGGHCRSAPWARWRVTAPVAPMGRSYREIRASLRSEEHTSELQSLMRKSYAVF